MADQNSDRSQADSTASTVPVVSHVDSDATLPPLPCDSVFGPDRVTGKTVKQFQWYYDAQRLLYNFNLAVVSIFFTVSLLFQIEAP